MKRNIIVALVAWFGFDAGVLTAADFPKELCFISLVFSIWLFVIIGCVIAMKRAPNGCLEKTEP